MLMVDPHKNAASNRGVRFSCTCTCTKPRRDACGPTCLYRPLKKRPPASAQRKLQDVNEIFEGLDAWLLRSDRHFDCDCYSCEDDYDPDDYEFEHPAPFKLAEVFKAADA